MRENKKASLSKSGQGADEKYISKWPYFSALQFLRDTVTKRPSTSSLDVRVCNLYTYKVRYTSINSYF